jgi:hypothetical protein
MRVQVRRRLQAGILRDTYVSEYVDNGAQDGRWIKTTSGAAGRTRGFAVR